MTLRNLTFKLFGWGRARRRFNEYRVNVEPRSGSERRRLMKMIGRKFRDHARRNITTQGGGKWKPLSKWTRARTGRRKALVTLRPRIKFRATADQAVLFFERRDPHWTLSDHHRGFRSPPVRGKLMKVPLRNPGLLGLRGKDHIEFTSRKESVIPARPIWPVGRQAKRIIKMELKRYRSKVERRVRSTR
jgi:phage gpG-like protein